MGDRAACMGPLICTPCAPPSPLRTHWRSPRAPELAETSQVLTVLPAADDVGAAYSRANGLQQAFSGEELRELLQQEQDCFLWVRMACSHVSLAWL